MDRVLLALKWLYETSKCCCGGRSSGPDNTDTKLGALNLFVASFCASSFLSHSLYLFRLYFRTNQHARTIQTQAKMVLFKNICPLFLPSFISRKLNWSGQYRQKKHGAL
jgi:hypothetical protein